MLNDLAFRIYAICSSLLALQMIGIAAYTGSTRKKHLNPEDVKLFKTELVQFDEPKIARILRLHRNMLENNLPFFIIGALYLCVGGPLLGAEIGFIGYVFLRFTHMFAYLSEKQPWRTTSWGISVSIVAALALYVLYKVII